MSPYSVKINAAAPDGALPRRINDYQKNHCPRYASERSAGGNPTYQKFS